MRIWSHTLFGLRVAERFRFLGTDPEFSLLGLRGVICRDAYSSHVIESP
jgi:hypothetical protein